MRLRGFAAWCLLVVACLTPVIAVSAGGSQDAPLPQDLPPDFRIDRDSWEVPVEPGRSIHIENMHGDVRLRRNEIPRLDVFVVVQLQEQDLLRADVQIVETDEGMKVDVLYVPRQDEGAGERSVTPGDAAGEPVEAAAGQEVIATQDEGEAGFIRRVDMVAYVPSGSPLHVRTDDDLIEARETNSDIVAESTGGDLTIITEGSVTATTSSGSILAVLLFDGPGGSSVLETETGDIVVQIPDDLDIRLRAKTSGRITSEYPPAEGDTEGPGIHEVMVRVGTGEHEARVDSETGNVAIRAWRRSRRGL